MQQQQGGMAAYKAIDGRTRLPHRVCGALIAGCLVLGGTGVSTKVNAETLQQALTSAYRTNPRLDGARATLRATDEEVARAKSGFRPNIAASADINYQHTKTKPPASSNGDLSPKGYGVGLVQPIFNGFQTVNAVREAEALVRAGRETLRGTEQSVLLEAVSAYMDVVRDQAIVRLRENNVNVLTRELKATQDRFSVGEVTRTDVAQAQARRSGSVSALDLARANLKTSRANFERIVGHPPSNLVEPSLPQRILPKSLEDAINTTFREAPAVVGALYQEEGARHTVERIWGELLPSVQFEADYNKRFDPSSQIDQSEATTLTGRLNVPIYQGGEVHARVRQAKQNHISRLQAVEQARTEAKQATVAAWSSLQASQAQLVSDMAQVDANRTALAGVREEERVGQRTLLDVLNAEQELLNSEVNLVVTRRDLIVNAYATVSTIGRLNAQELALGTLVYDAEVHYSEVRRKWWGISITHADGRRESVDLWESHGRPQPAK
jgi:outer membrane protein